METEVDEAGRVILPADIAANYGIRPGARIELEMQPDGLRVRRPVTHLAKLYIEPTNRCNLMCRTCVRNVWNEPLGSMTSDTFERIMGGLRAFISATPGAGSTLPSIFFGGFGEPLAHPRIVEMVDEAKKVGSKVELITNGVLLSETVSRGLIAAGLDRLWVSLDGARPDSYADVRLGAELPKVIANAARFGSLRPAFHPRLPEIGVAFVAMRRNIQDLPDVIRLGGRLGATRYMVTNVLPYSAALCEETLYERAMTDLSYLPSVWVPTINLPKIDLDPMTREALYQVLRSQRNISFGGSNLGNMNNRCPFIEQGAAAIGWDGDFSPCLPLLHSHTSYLNRRERLSQRYLVGNVTEQGLRGLWHSPEHISFRQRVQRFDFSPCTFCGGCDLSLANEEDCFGNTFPTCGGCLWAQGLIRCP